MSKQITTISFFKYRGTVNKLWAFNMMLLAHVPLKKTRGLEFYKLLGSGRKNFDPRPDWSIYGLLQVWENAESAEYFFNHSTLNKQYQKRSKQHLRFYLYNSKAHGLWSGKNVFKASNTINYENIYTVVLTRATIKLSMLRTFWNYVPTSQLDLIDNPHILFAAGVGERPITRMATFSLWDSDEALHDFAYKGRNHQKAIQYTKDLKWYKEEMFCRFKPFRVVGSWENFTIPEALK